GARILSVACGHLREADLVDEAAWDGIASLIALDQDRQSLDGVQLRYGNRAVQPVWSRIQDLVRGDGPEGPFDLIYAAGLYDYLEIKTAKLLTERLTRKLDPGGTLLIGNMDACPEMAFADIVQAWTLITRTPSEMAALADAAVGPDFTHKVWADQWGAVVWLEASRKT
ncbi:MAG: hypothetical protein ABI672_10205, partial [Vicinamibacteria bacterium]